MAKANDRMGMRVLSDAELDLVAGGDPGNGNGAQIRTVTETFPGFTFSEKDVITPSGNVNNVFTVTTTSPSGTSTLHETIHSKPA
jgi:hypothetical protein